MSEITKCSELSVKKQIICQVIDAFDGSAEPALHWLLEPLPALNGTRPVDCLEDSDRLEQLKAVIAKVATGEFS